ncbi:Rrf2 family transcriptional regulator [Marinovum sp.]|uniref:RrF2 family transcriptional regulator n=1 Tax=Marinovum sp. TaxID=2024839 RepID=UPI002B26EA0B|nr:Rrf2 family transcriptional regulator [Marinovum sp.]
MRVTKRTSIAIRVLMYCASHSGRLVTKSEIANRCGASENHVAQVINQLAQLGFIETHRGRNGGLELARAPQEICIGEVFRAVEARVPITDSFADDGTTFPRLAATQLRDALDAACEAFFTQLDAIRLDTLIGDNCALREIIAPSTSSRV